MIVTKFGGAALADVDGVRRVTGIVAGLRPRSPVVVVSAHGGVTDQLVALADRAVASAEGALDGHAAAAIAARHRAVLAGLQLPVDLLDGLLAELEDLLRGIRLVGEASPRVRDHLASFGERLSARTVAACLRAGGVAAEAVDAWDLGLATDSLHGRARPLADGGRIAAAVAGFVTAAVVPVVTGFIAKDAQGHITTLGRNGSDYSAALIGAAIGAEEIQVWKEVDGIRTADPRVVPTALPIRAMSFIEASELSAFGSKVLHPATMAPAMHGAVPVRVLSTRNPAAPGTIIVPELSPADGDGAVRAIAHREGASLVTVTAGRVLPQHVFLARLFEVLAKQHVDVAPLSVSVGNVTFAAAAADVERVVAPLQRLGEVVVAQGQAVVAVVGQREAIARGGAGAVLQALAAAGVAVRCAGQGAQGTTMAVVVAADDCARAVASLHATFFKTTD